MYSCLAYRQSMILNPALMTPWLILTYCMLNFKKSLFWKSLFKKSSKNYHNLDLYSLVKVVLSQKVKCVRLLLSF